MLDYLYATKDTEDISCDSLVDFELSLLEQGMSESDNRPPTKQLHCYMSGLYTCIALYVMKEDIFWFCFKHSPFAVCKQFAQLRRVGGDMVQETVKLLLNCLFTNYTMSFLRLDVRSYGKK